MVEHKNCRGGRKMNEKLLASKQVSELLSTTRRHVMDLGRRGELRRVLVGRLVRFRPEDVERYIKEQVDKRVDQ